MLRPLIITLRPITCLPAYILSICVLLYQTDYSVLWIALRTLPIFWLTMSGFALNDYFDMEKDRLFGVRRPVAEGALHQKAALLAAAALITASLVWNVFYASVSSTALLLVTALGLIAYTPVAHRVPLVKGLYTALLCVTPLLYGWSISGTTIMFREIILLVVFITGRELLLDLRDLPCDTSFGLFTGPHYLGKCASQILGWGLMLLAGAIAVFLSDTIVRQILGSGVILTLCICLIIYSKNSVYGLKFSRLPLLLGALWVATLPSQ